MNRRREFLAGVGGFFAATGAFAEELVRTAAQTEGPFYPDKLPLDTDNDLIVVNNALTPAVGEVTWLTGQILTMSGSPVRNATVEIWQVDGNGAYLHSKTSNRDKRDGNFQGFGRFVTGAKGEYLFRTIKPVPYPGRTPHIHFKIRTRGQDDFVTQCYIDKHPLNPKDGVLKAVTDAKAYQSMMVNFVPIPNSRAAELTAKFNVVLGFTPEG